MPSAKLMESTSSSDGARYGRCSARKPSANAAAIDHDRGVTRLAALARVTGEGRLEQQPFVQAAGAVALQVDGHVAVADLFQRVDDRGRHVGLERARELVASDFDPRQLVVVPHAADAEPQRAQRLFGAL